VINKLPSLQQTIKENSLFTKKSLGQNFILDEMFLDKIVSCAFAAGENPADFEVTEIGAGPGGLTRAILRAGVKRLVVVEKDSRCIPILNQIKDVYGDRITIIEADALKTDVRTLTNKPRKVIANLPYNISAVLLTQWIKDIADFSSLTLMFQKEVAERIVAVPSTADYGRLSVIVQAFASPQIKMLVPPEMFTPPPKVTSALVHITPLAKPYDVDFTELENVLKTVFLHRRKMLRKSLQSFGNVEEICKNLNINEQDRPENLTVADFVNLTDFIKAKK
jgi:16S rRNA (adenine1518-N6/adenine1519-N6)-dimethyltransferase